VNELIFLLVLATSIWVYFDAKSTGIKKGLKSGFFDLGPAGWFLGSLLLWIIVFPAYLAKRQELKTLVQAKKSEEGQPDV